eukprot:scaffold75978_cov19-Tisochrysis_lutea.AAC.3
MPALSLSYEGVAKTLHVAHKCALGQDITRPPPDRTQTQLPRIVCVLGSSYARDHGELYGALRRHACVTAYPALLMFTVECRSVTKQNALPAFLPSSNASPGQQS